MRNIGALCDAFEKGITTAAVPGFMKADVDYLLRDGADCWRMYRFVPETAGCCDKSRRAASAFGELIRVADGLHFEDNGLRLHDFRNYLGRLGSFGELTDIDTGLLSALAEQLDTVFSPDLPLRSVHGDAKTANVVHGEQSTILDLDTLSSGWAALDFGDTVRSVCSEYSAGAVADVAEGYAQGFGGLLTDDEVRSLYWGILYVTGELAMRYYIDYASEEGYFKGKTPPQLLARAQSLMGQLCCFMEHEKEIRTVISRGFGKNA